MYNKASNQGHKHHSSARCVTRCIPPLKQARSGNQGGWEDRSGSSPMMKLDVGSSPAKVPCSRGPPDLPCSLFSSALGGSSCGRSCLLLAPPIELLYNPLLPFSCPVVVKVHYCRGQSRGRLACKTRGVYCWPKNLGGFQIECRLPSGAAHASSCLNMRHAVQ